ncbi:hypothetical protein ACTXJ1_13770 [Brachybacterium alimentarium]|uniref:hypothetical protein n=1 Tax=Brachybacterium alimentarium TaxID=47845 RepID=UPI001C69749B|nr:hypothetical protein [Brachybacterium alimentarium]
MNSTIPTHFLDSFWEAIDHQLDMIEAAKPTTSAEVLLLLDGSAKAGFFGGSGGDRQLLDSLSIAGWEVTDFHAIYYWTAQHPSSGDSLEYIEGDVYDRTDR